MQEYNLTMDLVFKIFFSKKLNYLKMIINELTELNIKEEDITFINNDIYGNNPEDKACILDMSVKLPNGEIVFIEMQNANSTHLVERFSFYTSTRLTEQIKRGNQYQKIKKVYGIFFINEYNEDYDDLLIQLKEKDYRNKKKRRCMIEKNIINLSKIKDIDKYEMSDIFKNFLKFMVCKNDMEMISVVKNKKELEEAYETLKDIESDADVTDYYIRRKMYELDRESEKAELKEEAEKEIQKGIKKGIEQNKLEVVKKMYAKNIEVKTISEITNLSLDKVKEILENE